MGLFSGGNSRTLNEYSDNSDNSVTYDYDLDERQYEAGEGLYEIGGFRNDVNLNITDGGAFGVVGGLVNAVDGIVSSALNFGGSAIGSVNDVANESLYYVDRASSGALDAVRDSHDESLYYVDRAGAGALSFGDSALDAVTASHDESLYYVDRAGAGALDFAGGIVGDVVGAALNAITGAHNESLYYMDRTTDKAFDFVGSQNDEVLDFAGGINTEAVNLAGQATVGANFSTSSASKNMMYAVAALGLFFVASKVFK